MVYIWHVSVVEMDIFCGNPVGRSGMVFMLTGTVGNGLLSVMVAHGWYGFVV